MLRNKSFWFMLAAVLLMAMADQAYASTGGTFIWEDVLNKLLTSLQGPVARFFILGSIIISGVLMAIGEFQGLGRKVIQLIFGLSLTSGAASIAATLFGVTSGALL